MIKAIAFDFDGVLVESVDVKTRAFEKLFANETPEIVSRILIYHRRNGGISRFVKFRTIYKDILHRPLLETEFERLCARFADLVMEEVVMAPWVEGALEFIGKHANRYTFFIVSATPHDEINEIAKRRGIERYFSVILGSPRTKDQLLLDVLHTHQLRPPELLYVGDAPNDWEAARTIGVPFIWRQTADIEVVIPQFSGPTISSLNSLDACLATLE